MKQICNLLLITAFIFTLSCREESSAKKNDAHWAVVADTIQYSVNIKADFEEEPWVAEQLKQLNNRELVDQLFESVYRHQAKAYNFLDNRPLTLEEVKEIEINPSYDRELAARLHFWECWKYNAQGTLFEKKVLKVMIAYEARTEDGELKGYKAGIVIEMRQ